MISFRAIDIETTSDVAHLVRWANDYSIRHLFLRSKDQSWYDKSLDLDYAHGRMRESLEQGRELHLIELDGEVVGEVSLDIDGPAIHVPMPGTAWLGIVLGEPRARGRGLGREAMTYIEALAKEKGAERAEIGVFEYNLRAQGLYKALGYREIATVPDYTWWKGKRWTDIRMGKTLL